MSRNINISASANLILILLLENLVIVFLLHEKMLFKRTDQLIENYYLNCALKLRYLYIFFLLEVI
jgi:hypothetical protein